MNKLQKICCILLAFILIVPFKTIPVNAGLLEEKREELLKIKEEIKKQKELIEQKRKEIATLEGQLSIISDQIKQIELQIQAFQLEIEKTNLEIVQTENEIQEKEKEIEIQKKILSKIIKTLYKNRDFNLVYIVFSSETVSDFLRKLKYLDSLKIQSYKTLQKIKALKEELEKRKRELEKEKKELEELKAAKENAFSLLESQYAFKANLLAQTQGEEKKYQEQLAKARAEEKAITAEIIRLLEEEKKKRERETTPRERIVNRGGFSYPLPGVNRISIIGGDFMDPNYGFGFPHTGIDLAAPQGTPVLAAGDGYVIVAHDSGGPGLSYVAIDHGNGYITKYLHLSEVLVTTGEIVKRGQIIGLSGGTPGTRGAGIFTTGPHLHFEINDYQGNPINPHNFLYFEPPL